MYSQKQALAAMFNKPKLSWENKIKACINSIQNGIHGDLSLILYTSGLHLFSTMNLSKTNKVK